MVSILHFLQSATVENRAEYNIYLSEQYPNYAVVENTELNASKLVELKGHEDKCLDAVIAFETVPELVGIAEIAKMTHWQPARIGLYWHRGMLPSFRYELHCGKLWDKAEALKFAEMVDRPLKRGRKPNLNKPAPTEEKKRPGRKRKNVENN